MGDFDVHEFCANPDVNNLRNAEISKDSWKFIAMYFNIPYKSNSTKAQIREVVVNELIHRDILTVEAVESIVGGDLSDGESTVESLGAVGGDEISGDVQDELLRGAMYVSEPVANLSESQINLKQRELEELSARRKWERESFGLVAQHKREVRQLDLEKEIKLREEEARIAVERKRKEMELELEFEREKVKIQLSLLENRSKSKEPSNNTSLEIKPFDISKNSILVGSFDEDDPEAFFESFEKLAKQLEWNKKYWSVLIQTKLVGKARIIYNNLNAKDSQDYDVVKSTVLLAYDQVQETYRQNFREHQKSPNVTFIEFAEELSRLFDKWLKSSGVTDFSSLKNLMLLDQFKFRTHPDLRVYLDEREVRDLREAARLADYP